MSDKIGYKLKAAGGKVEQRVGAATGDHDVEARGARHRGQGNVQSRWRAFTNFLSGGGSRAAGKSQASAGGLTGNHSARTKGNLKNLKGDLKQTVNH